MQPPVKKDKSIRKAEELTMEWIHSYLDEVYRIDDFFKAKQDELIDEFICLQDKLRCRTQKYGQNDTNKSEKGKEEEGQDTAPIDKVSYIPEDPSISNSRPSSVEGNKLGSILS